MLKRFKIKQKYKKNQFLILCNLGIKYRKNKIKKQIYSFIFLLQNAFLKLLYDIFHRDV